MMDNSIENEVKIFVMKVEGKGYNYVRRLKDGKEEFYGKLKNIAENLPAEFIMIHQSYIINQSYVSEYSYETVRMLNGENLNISKPYRKETRSKIKQYQKANMSDGSI